MTQSTSSSQATPKKQTGLLGAIAIGLASMLGAGVFVVFRDVAIASGSLLILSIAVAALVAILNSASIYQLAKNQSRAGGVYAYSRIYVSDSVSFVAGFSFVIGKIGSIAAVALVFEEYAFPNSGKFAAVGAILFLATINILGINRTAAVAAVLATITTLFLLLTIFSSTTEDHSASSSLASLPAGNALQGAALMFFAFAGYARVATLGNEVRNPKRNIPLAILISLGIVTMLYFSISFVLDKVLGASLIQVKAPFVAVFEMTAPWFPSSLVVVFAALAALGSMLALLAGVSRTAAEMAEDRELPTVFSLRNRLGSPWLAELVIATGSILLLQLQTLSWVIGFSSFSVLLYYLIGHVSCMRQPVSERRMPRTLNVIGVLLCLLLLVSVPGPTIPLSLGLIALAVAARRLSR